MSRRNEQHKNIVRLVGRENVMVCVFPCDSEEQALADEVQQIALLRREGYALANLSNGGQCGTTGLKRGPQSPEHKAKLAKAIGDALRGRKGKPQSDATKAKLREARLKQVMPPITEETREKLRQAAIKRAAEGRHPTRGKKIAAPNDDTRRQMSAIKKAQWADPNGPFAHRKPRGPVSEETKAKISAGMKLARAEQKAKKQAAV